MKAANLIVIPVQRSIMSAYLWMRNNPGASSRAYSAKRYPRDITTHLKGLLQSDCIGLYRLDIAGINHFVENIKGH